MSFGIFFYLFYLSRNNLEKYVAKAINVNEYNAMVVFTIFFKILEREVVFKI